jgi:PAS domain S-box-containing protein
VAQGGEEQAPVGGRTEGGAGEGEARERLLAEQLQRVLTASERDRSLLDAIVAGAPFGLAFLDTDLRYLLVNDRMSEINGASVEDMLTRPRREILGDDMALETEPLLRSVLDTGEPVTVHNRTRLPSEPDQERDFRITYYAVDATDGTRLGVAGVVEDITVERAAEQERATLQAQLEEARRLETVGQLAGGVAHDFNNLLAVIGLRSELLRRRHPAMADLVDNLLTIERAVAQGRELAQRLLTFSRRQRVVPQVVELDAVLRSLDGLIGSLTGERIHVAVEPSAPGAHVLIDPGALEQVVLNLVINARDALVDGGSIIVTTALPEAEGPVAVAELVVTDDGTGMTEEVAAQAFDPFFTTKGSGVGSGLGLPTVYGIVSGAGGSITLDTAPGEGTRVLVRLPLTDPASGRPMIDTKLVLGPGVRRLVLVVDDEMDITKVVSDALRGAGYEVVVATSGHTARSLVADRLDELDLVVTDVMMPGGTGPELMRSLQAHRPDLPVIYMSGFAARPGASEDLPDDITLLRKPFTIDELLLTVGRTLAAHR